MRGVLYTTTMEQRFIQLSTDEVDQLLVMLKRAEGYCRNARGPSRKPSKRELNAEPTEFYSGASGYAGATMRLAINTLEAHL